MARKTTSISASFKKAVPSEKCVWNKEGAPKADKGTSGSNKKSKIVSSSCDAVKTEMKKIDALIEAEALKEIEITHELNMKTGAVGPQATSKKAAAFMKEKNVPVREVFEKLGWPHIKENAHKMDYWAENAVLVARVAYMRYEVDHKSGRKKAADIVERDYLLNKIEQTKDGARLSSTVSAFHYNLAAAEAVRDDDILILCIDKNHLKKEQMRLILE